MVKMKLPAILTIDHHSKKFLLSLLNLFLIATCLLAVSAIIMQRFIFQKKAAPYPARLDLPATLNATIDSDINVPIFLSTKGASIVGVDVVISFDRGRLTLTDILTNAKDNNNTTLKTFAPVDASKNFDKTKVLQKANNEGVIDFGAVTFDSALEVPTTAFNTDDANVILATLVFRPQVAGTTDVRFDFSNPGSGPCNSNGINTCDSNIVTATNPPVDTLEAVTNLSLLVEEGPTAKVLSVIRAPSGGVNIDGHLSEFARANSITFSDSGRGADDNTAIVKTMWDDNYLYIAYDVSDTKLNSLVNTAGQGAIWEDDNLELLIDRSNNHKPWKETNDDHQYFVNLNNVRDDRGENLGDKFKSAVFLKGGTLNDNSNTDQGYQIEAALTWSALGGKPSPGDKIGIDFAAGDKDPSAGYQYYDWANLTIFAQPNEWGDLLIASEALTPTPTPTPTPTSTPGPTSTPTPTVTPGGPTLTPTPTTSASCLRKGEGDANCDGEINGIDYSLWLNSQCRRTATQSCASTKADFNGDSNVDDEDYKIWFDHSR